MIRSLKILGLLALAALAMSAMLASAAQGDPKGVFTVGETEGVNEHTASLLHGEQYGTETFFEFNGSKFACENAGVTYTGTDADGTAKTLTIAPTYKDCLFGSLPMTVTMNGCDYIFTQPTRINTGPIEWTGKVDLTCPTGKKIEMHVYSGGGITSHSGFSVCTITIYPKGEAHEQELGGHVIYTPGEKDGKDDLTARLELEGITTVQEGLCGAKTDENAKSVSTITLTGNDETSGSPHDLWISEEE